MQSPSVYNAVWLHDRQRKQDLPCEIRIPAEAGINLFYAYWTKHSLM